MSTGYFLLGAAVALYVIIFIVCTLVFRDLLNKESASKDLLDPKTTGAITWVISAVTAAMWPILLVLQGFLAIHKWISKDPSGEYIGIPDPPPAAHNYTDWTQN